MPEKTSPSAAFICFVAGLFTIATSNTANATECFPGPDFKPASGTGWQYRIDSATNQGCWYIQELGDSSQLGRGEVTRSSRSVPVSSWTSESAPTSGATRSNSREETPAAAPQSSIMAWFSSTFGSLTSSPDAYSTTKAGVAAMSASSATPKRYNESTSPRQSQQTKVTQRKSEREQSESARQDSIISILEAAGDKPVLSPPILRGQDLQRAIEAIGDKDVVIAPTDPKKDWQQALYEEFLRWRTGQLIFQ
jgi:hypothetical protein